MALCGLCSSETTTSCAPPQAQRLGLRDRGLIQTGMKADIVVFDPARVRDQATYDRSRQYAEGIPLVIVNGQVVFGNNAMTPARPGRVLYGPPKE